MRPQFCLLTEASVDASRASSRVDFTSTCCRVAPTRGSLLQSKRYLSRSSPLVLLLGQAYQSFTILSTFFVLSVLHLSWDRYGVSLMVDVAVEVATGVWVEVGVDNWVAVGVNVVLDDMVHTCALVNSTSVGSL